MLFSLQRFGESEPEQGEDLPFKQAELSHVLPHTYSPAKFDLSVFLSDAQSRITGVFNYATALFSEHTIAKLVDSYTAVLRALVASAANAQQLNQINIMSEAEWARCGFNAERAVSGPNHLAWRL